VLGSGWWKESLLKPVDDDDTEFNSFMSKIDLPKILETDPA
jgi:hypothetical protein